MPTRPQPIEPCGALANWLAANGATLHPSIALMPLATNRRRVQVSAVKRVEAGSMLLHVPKASILSPVTCSASKVLRRALDAGCAPTVVLNLAIALERSLGARSRWAGFLSTIPDVEPLPHAWSSHELEWLRGTGLDVSARARREELVSEHNEIIAWLGTQAADEALSSFDMPTLEEYTAAASLASSRGFYVDGVHGEALVPGACAFNHKAALLPDGAVVEGAALLETGDDEDHGDGGGDGDSLSHASSEAASEAGFEAEGDLRVASTTLRASARVVAMARGVDLAMDCTLHNLEGLNEAGSAEMEGAGEEEVGKEGEEGEGGVEEMEGEEYDEDVDRTDDGAVGIVALRALRRGGEIFNTYGEHGNWHLLHAYGFTLEDNPLDVALLSWECVLHAVGGWMGVELAQEREALLVRCGWSAHADGAIGVIGRSFALDRLGCPPPELLLALWLLCATPEAGWMTSQRGACAMRDRRRKAAPAGPGDGVTGRVKAFLASPLSAQLTPPHLPVGTLSLAPILLSAVRMRRSQYCSPPAPWRARSQREQDAARLVSGELAIWHAVEAVVDAGGTPVVGAAGAPVGATARHAARFESIGRREAAREAAQAAMPHREQSDQGRRQSVKRTRLKAD